MAREDQLAELGDEQDVAACSGVQRGLRSRLAEPGRFSHLEKPLWQLARWVLEWTGPAPSAGA